MITKTIILSSVLTSLLATSGCPSGADRTTVSASMSGPRTAVSVDYFRGELSGYGRWIDYAGYGWCWVPGDVVADWRPYSDGYWVYSDYGWTWVSNEPWGWATYHYGRWLLDDDYGWVWIPDTVWAPAWVAWRMDDDYVGWAPLPPDASWGAGGGLRFASFDRIPTRQWCFVSRDHLGDRNLRAEIEPTTHAYSLVERTRDVTRFESRGGRPFNRGPEVERVARGMSRPLPQVRIQDVDSPRRGGGQPAGDGVVGFYRPGLRDRHPGENRAFRGRPDDPRRDFDRKHQKRSPQQGDPKQGANDEGSQKERGDRRHG